MSKGIKKVLANRKIAKEALQLVQSKIDKAIDISHKVKEKYDPISNYIHGLLHFDVPKTITPLCPFKVFVKRIYYQDTL